VQAPGLRPGLVDEDQTGRTNLAVPATDAVAGRRQCGPVHWRAGFYGMARPFLSIGRMLVLEERRSEPCE
jgi:hypothetical protein